MYRMYRCVHLCYAQEKSDRAWDTCPWRALSSGASEQALSLPAAAHAHVASDPSPGKDPVLLTTEPCPEGRRAGHGLLSTGCLRQSSLPAETMGSLFSRWCLMRWLTLSKILSLVRTCEGQGGKVSNERTCLLGVSQTISTGGSLPGSLGAPHALKDSCLQSPWSLLLASQFSVLICPPLRDRAMGCPPPSATRCHGELPCPCQPSLPGSPSALIGSITETSVWLSCTSH